VKQRRLEEVIAVFRHHAAQQFRDSVGQTVEVLIEGDSKRSDAHWCGRTSQNKMVVFPKESYPLAKGDYVMVHINETTSGTLLGKIVLQ
jgi:tRNA-2-methylthio-N6-dimethylallyladenosine synthase